VRAPRGVLERERDGRAAVHEVCGTEETHEGRARAVTQALHGLEGPARQRLHAAPHGLEVGFAKKRESLLDRGE
jgi:hypothetical protein